jgi:hypothetical protein
LFPTFFWPKSPNKKFPNPNSQSLSPTNWQEKTLDQKKFPLLTILADAFGHTFFWQTKDPPSPPALASPCQPQQSPAFSASQPQVQPLPSPQAPSPAKCLWQKNSHQQTPTEVFGQKKKIPTANKLLDNHFGRQVVFWPKKNYSTKKKSQLTSILADKPKK